MRYLQVPSRFHFTTPSLFRRRSSDEKGGTPNAAGDLPRSMQQRPGPRTTAGRGFAVKFYDILDKESSEIITWTQSGQAFQVLDYTRFSEEILLKYFRHNKFSSFRRQLNLYGYRKVIKGPDAGAYMHPFFQRGRRDLLGEVKKGKVPHYDIHGVNEIHGQHFRHHPPGAKNKENAARLQGHPAQLSPGLEPNSSPVVTPEIRGEDGYGNLAVRGAPGARMMQSPSRPVPHMTPGTQAATALSNMSLSPTPHQNNTWGPPAPQPGQGMDALTLTPAWGGAAANAGVEGGGAPGAASNGKQPEEGKAGADGSAGGSGSGSGGGGDVAGVDQGPVMGNRLAYWEKTRKRRTMSAQVVFPLQPPKNTEVIDQADPSLCDVMDVICQCMEVRSSSESQQSQLSTLSGCSFNLDPMKRTSISDLLTCMSWESAWRNSGAFRGSLAGPVDPTMFDGDSGDAGIRISGGSTGVGGGSDGDGSSNNNNNNAAPPRPNLEQQASFDPTREPSGVTSGLISGMTQPAVIAASPLSSAGGGGPRDHGAGDGGGSSSGRNNQEQQEESRPASRPSFDPNRESSIADGIRAAGGPQDSRINGPAQGGARGGGGRGGGRQVSGDGASQAAFIGSAGGGAGSSGNNSGSVSRETSRGSTAKRIFNSAPPPSAAAAAGRGGGGYHEGWANGSGRVNSADSSSTVRSAIPSAVPTAGAPEGSSNSGAGVTHDPVHWVLPSSQASATGSAATSSTWGLLPQEQLRQVDGSSAGLGRVASAATISSAASSSPSTQGAQVFSRPRLGRMGSLQWLTEPTPCRRPTINETHEVNRLLSNQANFDAWSRVADDPDSIMLAKNIGDFLG